MKIITGPYEKVRKKCSEIFKTDFFEFSFPFVDEGAERFRELDRFLFESRKKTRFKNRYKGNVVIDVSAWNDRGIFNDYFDSFMYFIIDSMDESGFILTADKPCSAELISRLKRFFDISEICLTKKKKAQKVTIGFAPSSEKEDDEDVRI